MYIKMHAEKVKIIPCCCYLTALYVVHIFKPEEFCRKGLVCINSDTHFAQTILGNHYSDQETDTGEG